MALKNLKWVVAFILVVTIISNLTTCHNSNTWQNRYKTYYDSTHAVLRRSDSLAAVAAKTQLAADSEHESNIRRQRISSATDRHLKKMLDSTAILNAKLDSAVHALGPTNPATCNLCLIANQQLRVDLDTANIHITQLKDINATDAVEISNLRLVVHTDTISINALRTQLVNLPKPAPEPRLFGVFRMNDNQAFLAGAIVTIASFFILRGR